MMKNKEKDLNRKQKEKREKRNKKGMMNVN